MSATSSKSFERRAGGGAIRADLSVDRKFRGTAIVFNSLSVDLGGFREVIKPEAVDRTLREGLDVRALFDHNSGQVLGRTTSGTLLLRKTRSGLGVEIDPPDTSFARDLLQSVERGDISGMSFGFRVLTDEWRLEDGEAVRDVFDMVISEVSIVAFPAYEATDASVAQRSLQAFRSGDGAVQRELQRRRHQLQVLR